MGKKTISPNMSLGPSQFELKIVGPWNIILKTLHFKVAVWFLKAFIFYFYFLKAVFIFYVFFFLTFGLNNENWWTLFGTDFFFIWKIMNIFFIFLFFISYFNSIIEKYIIAIINQGIDQLYSFLHGLMK